MKINDFKLEVFFDKYEFTAPYLLAQSDCEAMSVAELLAMEPGAEAELTRSWLGYTEVAGSPALREEVARLYKGHTADDVLMFAGAQEAVFAAANVLLDAGDHIVCMFPIYQSLFEVANAIGAEVTKWELRDTGGRWELDFDELESLLRPNTRMIVINTPNNPTGYTLSEAQLRRLAEIAGARGIYVFSDEVYQGLPLDGQPRPSMAEVYEKGLSLGVLSKAYGLAGLRIGWLACRDRALLGRLKKYKHYMSICNSGPSEILAGVALRRGEALLARSLGIIKENLRLGEAFFARWAGLFSPRPPQCGPIAFHKMELEEPIGAFCERLVDEAGVLLLPGSVYAVEGPYFRMGYGRANFAENLAVFERWLEKSGMKGSV